MGCGEGTSPNQDIDLSGLDFGLIHRSSGRFQCQPPGIVHRTANVDLLETECRQDRKIRNQQDVALQIFQIARAGRQYSRDSS
jgi:hypothetical protein